MFQRGQIVPTNKRIDPASYLQQKNAVTNAVRDVSAEYRQKFIAELNDGLLSYGAAISHTRRDSRLAVSGYGL